MKGKFSTKTILISILTVILLAVAITGTVLFLKDSGKASAAQEDKKAQESQEVTLPVTGTDKQNEENTLPTTEENNTETNQEANQGRINEEVQNNNTQTNSNVQTERRTSENDSTNRVQGEQEFFTYRDKLVSEDFLVGWTPITVKALIQTSENELNVPELKINKKSYTEADIIYKDEGIVFPEETRYTYTRPEEKIFYEINVANISKIDAKNIRVYDTIPEGTTLFQKPENAEFENGKLTWTINIPAETEVSLRFIVTVNKEKTSGTIRNFAIVNGDKTNETENPVITYKKSVKQTEPLHEEEIIDYTISITNTGEVDTIVKQVEDTIPEGITYRQNSASHNGNYNEEDRKITWYDIPLLKNETVEITFKATVDKLPEGIYSKTIKNIAIVDGDNTNEVINEVVKPHITRLKENNPVEAENLHEGDTITYKITVGNDGTEAKTIKIEDEAPEGTTLKEIITAGGSKVGEKGVVWENVTLNPGDSRTFEFSVTVNNLPEKEYGKTIKNTAKVDGKDTNEVTNHVVKPHITAEKVSNPKTGSTVKYGEIITYTIKVKNDGTETKTVDITDNIPLNTEFDSVQDQGTTITNNGKVTGVKWTKTIPANTTTPITVSFKVKVTGNVAQKIENKAIVDNEETNKTEHEIVKDIKITTKSYTGKNVILVLDLSSSMLDKTSNGKTRLEVLKKEANKFIDNILVNTNNTITLVTFNYDSYDNAIKNSQELDRRYKTTYEANLRSLNRAFVGTTVQKRNSNNATDLKNIINSISLKRALLTNIQVAMRTTLEEVNKLSNDLSRETVVVFIGDGAPSCTSYEDTSKPGDNGTYYGFDTQTNTEKAINNYANKIKTKAKIYTVGFELQGEDAWKQEISNRIIAKMSNDNGTESNNYHFLATANDLSKKLSQIGEALGEPKTINLTTNNVGEVNEKLPKNTKLKIDEKRPVILNIDSEQRSFKTINEIQDYFNSTGRLKYDTAKNEFIIYATKFNPESKISLSYYYTK